MQKKRGLQLIVTAKILKDEHGNPTVAEITKRGRTLKVSYDPDLGFTFTGPRSVMPSVVDIAALIYPPELQQKLVIPEPLSVVNVSGGKTVLFDDFEELLKWSAGALDNTNAFNGGKSLKLTMGGGAAVSTSRRFALSPHSRYKVEVYFACDDWTTLVGVDSLKVSLFLDNGVTTAQATLQYDRTGLTWYMYDNISSATFKLPKALDVLGGVEGTWHKLSFVVDFKSNIWECVDVNSFRSQLNIGLLNAASSGAIRGILTLRGHAGAGGANLWFDDVLIQEI